MSKLVVHDYGISVKLTPFEKFWSISGDFEIPVTSIRGAEVVPGKALSIFKGINWAMRVGTAIPGVYYAGRFFRSGGADFMVVRAGKPAVQLNLSGKPYLRVILTVDNAEMVAEEINSALAAC
ncbi:MAG: hypothetical protein RL142_621 [Actinomycetota bacterium]|jgi:hypothetical protein